MKNDTSLHDQNDIKLLNAIAALQMKFGSTDDAQGILELSRYLNAQTTQTNRLIYGVYVQTGLIDKARAVVNSIANTLEGSRLGKHLSKIMYVKKIQH